MSKKNNGRGNPLMISRNPEEEHRQASFLELFYDLCFVVAIAYAATELHHALAEAHIATGLSSFMAIAFSIWWAWLNYTWYASAYDTDDVPFRLATFVQIIGALVIASGVQRAFEEHDLSIIFIGYLVTRASQVYLWIRAAYHDSDRRATALRYAWGLSLVMIGWGWMYSLGEWPLWGWLLMVFLELSVPFWAESKDPTPWHPAHMAERYGLFFIIVLGESVTSATSGLQIALGEHGGQIHQLAATIAGGILMLFSMWWLYFFRPSHEYLKKTRVPVLWGYGHYFIFASVTALGAALVVGFEHAVAPTRLSNIQVAWIIASALIVYLLMLWLLIWRPQINGKRLFWPILVCVLLITACTFSAIPVLLMGIATTLLVVYLLNFQKKVVL